VSDKVTMFQLKEFKSSFHNYLTSLFSGWHFEKRVLKNWIPCEVFLVELTFVFLNRLQRKYVLLIDEICPSTFWFTWLVRCFVVEVAGLH